MGLCAAFLRWQHCSSNPIFKRIYCQIAHAHGSKTKTGMRNKTQTSANYWGETLMLKHCSSTFKKRNLVKSIKLKAKVFIWSIYSTIYKENRKMAPHLFPQVTSSLPRHTTCRCMWSSRYFLNLLLLLLKFFKSSSTNLESSGKTWRILRELRGEKATGFMT